MDLLQWILIFLQTSVSELAKQNPSQSVNSLILFAYMVLSISLKRPSLMMAFFFSCMLFEMRLFDPLSEASLYLLTFAIYSYVIACNGLTLKQRIACGIILTLSITLAYDAYYYGMDGIYGTHETILYGNIEHLALYAHLIFIGSLIPYRRIGDSLRRYIDSFMLIARNSANFVWL
jgi:hypothetical protein